MNSSQWPKAFMSLLGHVGMEGHDLTIWDVIKWFFVSWTILALPPFGVQKKWEKKPEI